MELEKGISKSGKAAMKQAYRNFTETPPAKREIIRHRTESDTFVREFPNHAPIDFCDMMINMTNEMRERKRRNEMGGMNGGVNESGRKDFYYFLTEGTSPNIRNTLLTGWSKLASTQYIEEFPQLGASDFWMSAAKIQMTLPGEGFHQWHYDNAGFFVQAREFVFITYLNDDFEGGETEFRDHGLRVKPEKGKTVIFPAGYTHMHRGNPPIGGTKYIATTWANRLPRIDKESQSTEEIECISPSDQMIKYYRNN